MADAPDSGFPTSSRSATILELLKESTDFRDFLRLRSEVDVVDDGPNPVEFLMTERRGGRWSPEDQ